MTIICDTPESIKFYQLAACKAAVKLETLGMKHSWGSVTAFSKRLYGLKGNKQSIYKQLCEMVEEVKAGTRTL